MNCNFPFDSDLDIKPSLLPTIPFDGDLDTKFIFMPAIEFDVFLLVFDRSKCYRQGFDLLLNLSKHLRFYFMIVEILLTIASFPFFF